MLTKNDLMVGARLCGTVSPETRDAEVRRLMDDERFPALLSVILEFEEDMAATISDYHRSSEERMLDAGGLATMRRFREYLEALLVPVEKEPEAPK